MFAEKFSDLYNSGSHNLLLCDNSIEDIKYLESTNNPPSLVGIERNLTRGSYNIFFGTFADSGHFDCSEITGTVLSGKCIIQTNIFDNRKLTDKVFGFDTLMLENSYDESQIVRDDIKTTFDSWKPYYKAFLKSSLNCFDGESDNYLTEVGYSSYDYLVCHEYPTSDYSRDSKIIKELCNLYKITTTNKDLYDLYQLIEKLKPLLEKDNLKLNFKLNQSKTEIPEIELVMSSIVHETREEIFTFISDELSKLNFISQEVRDQLNTWDDQDRKIGHISLKIRKQDMIRVEIIAAYGFV